MAFSKIEGFEVMPRRPSSVDQALQFAAREQIAADVVEPDGLAERQKLGERIGGFCGFKRAHWIHNIS